MEQREIISKDYGDICLNWIIIIYASKAWGATSMLNIKNYIAGKRKWRQNQVRGSDIIFGVFLLL